MLAHSLCPLGDKAGDENETFALVTSPLDPLGTMEAEKVNVFVTYSLIKEADTSVTPVKKLKVC